MEMLRKKDEEEENSRNRMRDQAAQVRTGNILGFKRVILDQNRILVTPKCTLILTPQETLLQ